MAGSGVAIALETSTTPSVSVAVDDVADDLADHLLAAAHRARVEERRDDGADEGVARLVLLADLARRRLPSLEDVERDAREAPVVRRTR